MSNEQAYVYVMCYYGINPSSGAHGHNTVMEVASSLQEASATFHEKYNPATVYKIELVGPVGIPESTRGHPFKSPLAFT